MKKISFILAIILVQLQATAQTSRELVGAWETLQGNSRIVMICTENFFSAAVYDISSNNFIGTCGGAYRVENSQFVEIHEFNTMKPEWIGKEMKSKLEMKNQKLVFEEQGSKKNWTRIDDGQPGKLAGAWLITGRMEHETMSKITPSARRTMKILSGKRFQWIAYNVETKEFFGTGGGTYTTEDGKYKETIEFFSRDVTRVGKTLEFDFSLEGDNWRHKGLSSKGDPIDEVWTRREKIGL